MLTESLGDELAAKDLIDIALAMDEFKWVCISQTFVHTVLSLLDTEDIYLVRAKGDWASI